MSTLNEYLEKIMIQEGKEGRRACPECKGNNLNMLGGADKKTEKTPWSCKDCGAKWNTKRGEKPEITKKGK